MAVIDLRERRGPSVEESSANVRKILDLLGEQERLRQDRQSLSDFVSENLRLQGENARLQPEFQLSPDEISQRAALSVTQKDPQFAKGLQGAFQKFASGLTQGPSTALTGPIAEGLLKEPTGIRRDLIRSQIEANRARTQGTGVVKATASERQRDSDIAILNREKANTGQQREARERLRQNADLFKITASIEEIDEDFRPIMEELKDLKIKAPGNIFRKIGGDKMFGKEAFDAGLKEAKLQGLKLGIHEDSTEEAFIAWWDAEAAKEDPKGFGREFQPTSEFEAEPETKTGGDISAQIEKALKAGTVTQEERDTAIKALQADPTKADVIREALGL